MLASPRRIVRRTEQIADRLPLPDGWRIGAGGFVRVTIQQVQKDRLPVYAGNLAFHGLLGLFPALLTVLWLLQAVESGGLINTLLAVIDTTLPKQVAQPLHDHLKSLPEANGGVSVSFSAALALLSAMWLVTGAFRGMMDALNAMYAVEEHRPWWKRYGLSLGLAAAVLLLLVGAMALIVSGDALAERVARATGWGPVARWAWTLVTWPAVAAAAMTAFSLVYYYAPDVEQRVRWVSPGAVIAVALWLLFTVLFSIYANHAATYTRLYGALAGIAVFLVYLYGSGFILLLGAEMNQVIEMRQPDGKNEGDKAPTDGNFRSHPAPTVSAASSPDSE